MDVWRVWEEIKLERGQGLGDEDFAKTLQLTTVISVLFSNLSR